MGAVRDLVNKADMIEEARNAGLFAGELSMDDLIASMPPELRRVAAAQDSGIDRAGKVVFDALALWMRKPMGKLYAAEDTFFKYLIYRDARASGLAPDAAVEHANRYIFSYDDLPAGARRVRDYAIPFFAWSYKAVPALLHTALVYPWRFAAPAAVLHGMNAVAYALAAGDDEDDWWEMLQKGRKLQKQERAYLPEHMAGRGMLGNPKAIRLGTDSTTGLPLFLDAARLVPGGDMLDMENQAGGLNIPAPLMPNHPILGTFASMLANRDMFFGGDIVDRNDSAAEAWEKRAKWMAGQLLPAVSPGSYHSQRLLNAWANYIDTTIETPLGDFTGVGRDGLPVQPKYAAMQTIGIKARPVDLDLEQERKQARERGMVRSMVAEVRSMQRQYQRGAASRRMLDDKRQKEMGKIRTLRERKVEDDSEE